MKQCENCSAEVPDEFTICWKCNYHFASKTIATFEDVRKGEDLPHQKETTTRQINCLRCLTPMDYKGRHRFDRKTALWAAQSIWDLLLDGMMLEVHVCPKCKKVEFFGD
ncbi:MAG: hypothetical protein AAGG75_04345 [Bacteroidota bacterium]